MNDKYWYELGCEMKIIYSMGDHIWKIINNQYGKSDRYTNIACRIDKLHDKIRCDLDTIVCNIYPRNQHDLELYPDVSITHIFYGPIPDELNNHLPYPAYSSYKRPCCKTLTDEQRDFIIKYRNILNEYLNKIVNTEFISTFKYKTNFLKNVDSLREYANML